MRGNDFHREPGTNGNGTLAHLSIPGRQALALSLLGFSNRPDPATPQERAWDSQCSISNPNRETNGGLQVPPVLGEQWCLEMSMSETPPGKGDAAGVTEFRCGERPGVFQVGPMYSKRH